MNCSKTRQNISKYNNNSKRQKVIAKSFLKYPIFYCNKFSDFFFLLHLSPANFNVCHSFFLSDIFPIWNQHLAELEIHFKAIMCHATTKLFIRPLRRVASIIIVFVFNSELPRIAIRCNYIDRCYLDFIFAMII